MTSGWITLLAAGICETAFAFCLGKAKETSGNEAIIWYIVFAINMTLSMYLLIRAIETIPIGTAYAVWTGIGAVGSVVLGILYFKEPATTLKLFFLFTLISSIIGLKYVSGH